MVECDDFRRHGRVASAFSNGISRVTVQKILGPDRSQTTAIDLSITDTHILEEFELEW
jgi:hypothetical protein